MLSKKDSKTNVTNHKGHNHGHDHAPGEHKHGPGHAAHKKSTEDTAHKKSTEDTVPKKPAGPPTSLKKAIKLAAAKVEEDAAVNVEWLRSMAPLAAKTNRFLLETEQPTERVTVKIEESIAEGKPIASPTSSPISSRHMTNV